MDDARLAAMAESLIRDILRLDEEAGKGNQPGCMPLQYALSGELRYRWIDIRVKAKQLLEGKVR